MRTELRVLCSFNKCTLGALLKNPQSKSLNTRSRPGSWSISRGLVAWSLVAALLSSSVSVLAAGLDGVSGSISVNGTVQVNGQSATSGQTLFSKSQIVTSQGSESLIDFANSVRVRLAEQTSLTLESSPQRVSAAVLKGHVHFLAPKGIMLDLSTNDATIEIVPDENAVFDLDTAECEGTTISVDAGRLYLQAAGASRTLFAGETLSTRSTRVHNFSRRKKVGLLTGIGAAVAIVLLVIAGNKTEQELPEPAGCIDLLSGQSNCH
jgi:hypothetical protein